MMEQIEIYLLAFLPAVMVAVLIYRADNLKHEPVWLVALSFAAGVAAALITNACPVPRWDFEMWPRGFGLNGRLYDAFYGKAMVAEVVKFLLMFVLFCRSKSFDEYVDGFVYAGAIALGYVGVENLAEILNAGDNTYGVVLGMAIFAVPAHVMCAATMGFFFANWKMGRSIINLFWALLLSVSAHAIYDTAVSYLDARGVIVITVGLCELALMIFGCFYLDILIGTHRLKDEEIISGKE